MNGFSCAGSCGGFSSPSSSSDEAVETQWEAEHPAKARDRMSGQLSPTMLQQKRKSKTQKNFNKVPTKVTASSNKQNPNPNVVPDLIQTQDPEISENQKCFVKSKTAKIRKAEKRTAKIKKSKKASTQEPETGNQLQDEATIQIQNAVKVGESDYGNNMELDTETTRENKYRGRINSRVGFDEWSGNPEYVYPESDPEYVNPDSDTSVPNLIAKSTLMQFNYTQSALPPEIKLSEDIRDRETGDGEPTRDEAPNEAANKMLGANVSNACKRISGLKLHSTSQKQRHSSSQKQLEAEFSELRSKFEKRWSSLEGGVLASKWRHELCAEVTDFSFLKSLGNGAFGNVYLVRHKRSDVTYAMKVLEKSLIMDVKMVFHALEEKRILAAIDFPFIVKTKYFFHDSVNIYFVMNFIPGGEMYPYYKAMDHLPEEQTKFFAAQIVLAFEYMQSVNILYRDLKPENVLIGSDGYIVLVDMGFAKKKVPGQLCYTMCGTPEYLAPEIILGQGYDEGVDWWSLGVMIYELSKGETPFSASPPIRMYQKIVTNKMTLPTQFSPPLRELLGRLLAKDASKRIGNNESKGRAKEVKSHAWFSGIDFFEIYSKRVHPPYIPPVKGGTDASFFGDKAPHFRPPSVKPDPFREYFIDF